MMADKKFIMVMDQGTTSSRALLIDHNGSAVAIEQMEFEQIFPQPGWVEHDPMEIWRSQYTVAKNLIKNSGIDSDSIAAIGITNQRETTIVWDRSTGKPICNAIVWQDRRTAEYCDELQEKGLTHTIRKKTGLLPDAYFSATKVKWMLDNIEGARQKAENGELAFGTVDSWLIWNLTKGSMHATDVSNASRTMLYNIVDLKWDEELLEIFSIPFSMLPEVKSSSELFTNTHVDTFGSPIPIAGVAGDQQAALFGQLCINKGMIKNTYGTGCFIMMNTGNTPIYSKNNLLSTIAWKIGNDVTYALEGSIFIGGAVVQWLRDGLGIIESSKDVEKLSENVADNGGVYLVPAFTGLGAPHWDPYARGAILGLTRGTTAGHVARAALESIAYQTKDVLDAMVSDADIRAGELRVDGGASANNLLMQFQADILGIDVIRPEILETTAMGAGFFAGLAVKYWDDINKIKDLWKENRIFRPEMKKNEAIKYLDRWKEAVERAKNWSN